MLTGVLFVIAVSTDGWMSREKVAWLEKVTSLSHRSSETPVIRNNTDAPWERYAERNKPGRVKSIQVVLIRIMMPRVWYLTGATNVKIPPG